jgi:hypothetical protein
MVDVAVRRVSQRRMVVEAARWLTLTAPQFSSCQLPVQSLVFSVKFSFQFSQVSLKLDNSTLNWELEAGKLRTGWAGL